MTLLAAARREGRSLVVTATDSRDEVLAAARLARPALDPTPGLELAIGGRSRAAVRRRRVRRRPCLDGRPPPRSRRRGRVPARAAPGRAARDRRQRPRPRPAELARRLAPDPRDRDEPLHPPRRPALRPAGLHAARSCSIWSQPRAWSPSRRSPGSPATGSRSRLAEPRRPGRPGRAATLPRWSGATSLVVGGGPAGAATAIGLAGRGRDVLVLERAPAWRWRACGVFTSPATVAALAPPRAGRRRPGARRPAGSRRCGSRRAPGRAFRLTYGDDGSLAARGRRARPVRPRPAAARARRAAGAEVREGVGGRASVRGRPGARWPTATEVAARVIVGADGLRSVVARDAGVARRPPLGDRAGADLPCRRSGAGRGRATRG